MTENIQFCFDQPMGGRALGLTAEVYAPLNALHRSLTVERSKTPFPRKPQP